MKDRLFRIVMRWAHEGKHQDPFRRTLLDLLRNRGYQAAVEYLATIDPAQQVQFDIEHGRAGLMGVFGNTLFFPGTDDDLRLHDRPYWPMPGTSDAIESPAHSAWIGAAIEFTKAYNTELRKQRPELLASGPTSQPSTSPR